MPLIRSVYNNNLECVAFEVLAPQKQVVDDSLLQQLQELINSLDSQLPLFIPYEYQNLIEQLSPAVESPIILKLDANSIETLYTLDEIKNSSYSIALLISTPQQLAWLTCAEYIGLTKDLIKQAGVSKVVQYSKAHDRKVIAYDLAETPNFNRCKNMTIDYYCGEVLLQPVIDDTIDVAANELNLLHLIQSIHEPDCDLQKISLIIQADPLLSYQLPRLANSAALSEGYPIRSIEQAVARLGLVNLQNWITLFSMKNISTELSEILESGLIRAYMAQEIAKFKPEINQQSAYTAGLLSILDCVLDKTMPDLISQMTLAPDIAEALTEKKGPLGELLNIIIAYEMGNWDSLPESSIQGVELGKLYIDSLALVANGSQTLK